MLFYGRLMKFILFSAFLIVFSACSSARFTADSLPKRQLLFGSGGGFVGKYTSNVLLENGQIFQKESVGGQFEEQKGIRKRKARAFFQAAEELELGAMDFNHPGNLSSFLEFQTDSTTARVTWGDPNFPVNQKVKDLHVALSELVK